MRKLGKNIRFLRKERGMSQEELANLFGYDNYTTVQKWETEKSDPPLKIVKGLSEYFGVGIDALVKHDLSSPSPTPPQASPNSAPAEPPDLSDRAVYCARLFDNAEARTQDDVILLLENHQKGERGSTLTNTA